MKTAALCIASVWLWALTNSDCFGWQTSRSQPSSEPAPPTSVDPLRQAYESLDQQARQLAEDLKQNKNNDEASKQELTKLVRESFEARQKWQRAQLAESKLRIEKLQQMLEARDGLKPQIVTRRVNELLNSKTEQTPNQQPQQQGNDPPPTQNKLDIAASSMLAAVSGSELLRTSPGDMRKLLWEKASSVLRHRSEVAEAKRTLEEIRESKDPKHELNSRAISESLKHYEAVLRIATGELEFAKLQYGQIIDYLQFVRADLQRRQTAAMDQFKTMEIAFKQGQLNGLELRTYEQRTRELDVDLHRVQSLLRLYEAAGDIPELKETN